MPGTGTLDSSVPADDDVRHRHERTRLDLIGHDIVREAEELGRIRMFPRQRPEDELGHRHVGGRRDAVPGHVPEHDSKASVCEHEEVEDVAADVDLARRLVDRTDVEAVDRRGLVREGATAASSRRTASAARAGARCRSPARPAAGTGLRRPAHRPVRVAPGRATGRASRQRRSERPVRRRREQCRLSGGTARAPDAPPTARRDRGSAAAQARAARPRRGMSDERGRCPVRRAATAPLRLRRAARRSSPRRRGASPRAKGFEPRSRSRAARGLVETLRAPNRARLPGHLRALLRARAGARSARRQPTAQRAR